VATRTVIRAGALALVAGTVAALAAACGGGGSSAGAHPTPSATGVQAQLSAYVKCLNQNGVPVTLPSGFGVPGGGGFGSGRPQRSGFPSGRPDRSGFPTSRPTARPSGSFGGFGGGGFLQKPESVDQSTWDKAVAACAAERPAFGGGGRGGDNGATAAYQNCLRDHGVTGGSSPSAAALQACEVLKPTGAPSSSS
jgi:hypothetical protein